MRIPEGSGPGPLSGGSGEPPSGQPAGGDFAALAPDLTARIGVILEAVQREADRMLDDARSEAQRQVDVGKRQADGLLADRQRRITELSDTLIARTEEVAAQLDETVQVRESFGRLLAALADAADRVTTEIAAAPMPPPTPEPVADPPPAPAPAPASAPFVATPDPAAPEAAAPASPAQGEGPASPEPPQDRAWVEARQAAIQMAAAGNTRAQVEAHLRGFLNVADPSALLDQVFGAATAGEARVPWAIAPSAPAWNPDSAGG